MRLGQKKICLLIRWSQSTHRSIIIRGLVESKSLSGLHYRLKVPSALSASRRLAVLFSLRSLPICTSRSPSPPPPPAAKIGLGYWNIPVNLDDAPRWNGKRIDKEIGLMSARSAQRTRWRRWRMGRDIAGRKDREGRMSGCQAQIVSGDSDCHCFLLHLLLL